MQQGQLLMVMGVHRRLLLLQLLMLHELLKQQQQQLKQQQRLQQPCHHQVMLLMLVLIDVLLLNRVARLHLARIVLIMIHSGRPSGAHSIGGRTSADGETTATMPIRSTSSEGVMLIPGRGGTENSGGVLSFVGRQRNLMLTSRISKMLLISRSGKSRSHRSLSSSI